MIFILYTVLSTFSYSLFFHDSAPTHIYTLSLHDALPICLSGTFRLDLSPDRDEVVEDVHRRRLHRGQIGEHTSELQSHHDLVCRLLLEKKKNIINDRKTPNDRQVNSSCNNT